MAGHPRYADVWLADLGPVVGSEIVKRRPVLLVSNDLNNQYATTVTVLPITSSPAKRAYPDEVLVSQGVAGLARHTNRIKANMVRTIDKRRLVSIVGRLPRQYHASVERADQDTPQHGCMTIDGGQGAVQRAGCRSH